MAASKLQDISEQQAPKNGCLVHGGIRQFREVQQTMPTHMIRKLVLVLLLLTLLIPPGELSAWAQDKDKQAPQPQTTPGFSISVTVPVVGVDVVVTDNNGNYLKDLKKENFRITEDSTVQTITNYAPSEAPITIWLLLEFSKLGYHYFIYNA